MHIMHFMKRFKKIGLFDFMIIIGCALLGYGLFILYGLGVSLSVMGGIFLFIGLFAEVAPIFIKKGS